MEGVAAFAFGQPETLASNRVIQESARSVAVEHRAQIFAQSGVIPDVALVARFEDPEAPTFQVARSAVLWAMSWKIDRLIAVCAPSHRRRVERDLWYWVRQEKANILVMASAKPRLLDDSIWFCRRSTQWWTRTRRAWEWRERVLLLLPMWLYKIVTG